MSAPTVRPLAGPAARVDDTRQALLAAAHDLLATEGPGALTVRRIAAAAGMSTMNVYSRFGGKDGVVEELFLDGFRRLGAAMEDSPSTDDALEDIRQCGRCYRQFARENATYYSLMFDRVVPDFRPSPAARSTAIGALGRVADRVSRAMDSGLLRDGDAFNVAAALWACQHGIASLEAHGEDGKDEFDWDVVAPLAVDALIRGLSVDP
ncbi:MAG: TetR/AcrR family transcriptional regulator [Ilumatobacteraceae bacterium]